MNCNEFRKRLSSAVESQDAAPTKRNLLRQHALGCPDATCRQLWADDELLAGVVPGWREAVPQVSLAGRVLAELGRDRTIGSQQTAATAGPRLVETASGDRSFTQPQTIRVTRSWLACAASVACLLLLIPLLRVGQQARTPAQPVAGNATPTGSSQRALVVRNDSRLPRHESAPSPPHEGPAAVSEVIRTYAGVPQTATEFVTDTVAMLLPEDLSDPNESEPSRPAQWRGRLSEQLEPWGRELGTAFDAFLETVSDPPSSSRFESPQTAARPLSA